MIGRFALLEALGDGGTATVWHARDPLTGQPAAVKLLREELTRIPQQRRAFLAEARLGGRVSHPGVVHIIDCGEQERPGLPPQAWLAMELLDGRSLAEQVRAHGPLSVTDALLLGEALLLALDAVHRAGLVHRDVTPANLMLRITPGQPLDPGTVRLCDLGLAGPAGSTPAAGEPTGSLVALTAGHPAVPAFVWGSAPYLAPEHAAGHPVSASADLYQVGGVLHFALTGQAPFVRDGIEALLQAHLAEPAEPPSSRRPEVPAAVDRLLLRALRKAPLERFDSALDMYREVHATRLALAENAVVTAPVPVIGAGIVAGIGVRAGAGAEPGALTGARAPQGITAHPVPAATGAQRRRRVSGRGLLVAGAAAVAALLAAGGVLGVFGDRATPRVDAVTAASPQAVPEPTTAPAPAVQRLTQVPELLGRSLAEARVLLEAAGLTVGQLGTSHSASPADTVLAMAQPAGMRVAPGTAVALTVASGWNAVPSTIGMSEAEATAALTAAGFTVTAQLASGSGASPGSNTTGPGSGSGVGGSTDPGTDPSSDTGSAVSPSPTVPASLAVRSTLPVAGTLLRLGSSVSLTLASPAAAPAAAPAPSPGNAPRPTTPTDGSGPADPPRPGDLDCSPAVSECLP